MIYYAVIYMKNGNIHLKPHQTKAEAEASIAAEMKKAADQIDLTKVYKKDTEGKYYKKYWI